MNLNEKLVNLKSKNKLFTAWRVVTLVILAISALALTATTGLVAGAGIVTLGQKIFAGVGATLGAASLVYGEIERKAHYKELAAVETQIATKSNEADAELKQEVSPEIKKSKEVVKKVVNSNTKDSNNEATK